MSSNLTGPAKFPYDFGSISIVRGLKQIVPAIAHYLQNATVSAYALFPFQGCQRPIERFVSQAQFAGHFLQCSGGVIDAR
ncbi:MAG: hypothetical protein WCD32_14045, partial [Azonexus sp.]